MKIKLLCNTTCAHDKHEITKYPRSWFKAKPQLAAGTVLDVEKEWNNFYGFYYRCKLPECLVREDYTNPYYDIEVSYAEVIEE